MTRYLSLVAAALFAGLFAIATPAMAFGGGSSGCGCADISIDLENNDFVNATQVNLTAGNYKTDFTNAAIGVSASVEIKVEDADFPTVKIVGQNNDYVKATQINVTSFNAKGLFQNQAVGAAASVTAKVKD